MQLRQLRERVAQAGQVARTCTAQRDARGDALHIHAGFELFVHGTIGCSTNSPLPTFLPCGRKSKCPLSPRGIPHLRIGVGEGRATGEGRLDFHRIQPGIQHITVAQRMVQPVMQQAAAHVGRAGVEQRQQRGRGLRRAGSG